MRVLWLALLLLLGACGGGSGGSSSQSSVPVVPQPRAVHFGYYGTGADIAKVAGHVSIAFEQDWDNHINLPQHMDVARANGLKVIIGVEHYLYSGNRYRGTIAVRPLLAQLRKLGMLDLVIGFYPADEPDLHYSDQDVRRANSDMRALCSEFPELGSCLLVVIYSDHQPVGLDSYDWIGRDRYGSAPQGMPLLPGQGLILIPGGADPWRDSPDGFVAYAEAHPEVVAVIAFVYPNYAGGFGIGENGMGPAYCKAGLALTLKQGTCP